MKQRLLIPSLDASQNPEASEQKPAQERSLPVLSLGNASFMVDARGDQVEEAVGGLSTTYTSQPEEMVIRVGDAVGAVVDLKPKGQTVGMVSTDTVGVEMGLFEETFAAVSVLTDHVRSLVEQVKEGRRVFEERQDYQAAQALDHAFHTAISEAGILLSIAREMKMDETEAQAMATEMRQSRQDIWKALLAFDYEDRVDLRMDEMKDWFEVMKECYEYDFSEISSDVIERSLAAFARYYEGIIEPHVRLYERNKSNPYFGYPAYMQVDKVMASFEVGFFKFFTILQDQIEELRRLRGVLAATSEQDSIYTRAMALSDVGQEEQALKKRAEALVGGLEHIADQREKARLGHKFESSINHLGWNIDGKLTGF